MQPIHRRCVGEIEVEAVGVEAERGAGAAAEAGKLVLLGGSVVLNGVKVNAEGGNGVSHAGGDVAVWVVIVEATGEVSTDNTVTVVDGGAR